MERSHSAVQFLVPCAFGRGKRSNRSKKYSLFYSNCGNGSGGSSGTLVAESVEGFSGIPQNGKFATNYIAYFWWSFT